MKNKLRLILAVSGLVAVAAAALAKSDVQNPHWFTDAEIQAFVQREPAPPAAGSPADQADFQADLAAQNSRTPAQIAEANTDAGYSVALFSEGMGKNVTPANNPVTFRFFDRCNKQIGEIVTDLKEHWKRPRPFQAHPEIHSLFGAGGYSYPSGHSAHSFAFAVILGQLFPERAGVFLDRAQLIAQSRVDAGVHYPTDIQEGEVVGKEIAKELLAKPAFLTELNAAKAELAAKK